MRLLFVLMIAILTVGCTTSKAPSSSSTPASSSTPTAPAGNHEFAFDLPEGWVEDPKTMQDRPDLLAIRTADGKGTAFGMRFDFEHKETDPTGDFDNELNPRLAAFLVAFEQSLPGRYEGFKLVRHGGVKFHDKDVAELVFTGRDTTKADDGVRWRRILVMFSPKTENRLILLGFGAPIGHEDDYREDFQAIEKSWRWN